MAYQVIPSLTTTHAVLQQLATFAGANGWEIIYSGFDSATSYRVVLRIPGVTDYVHLFSSATDIRSRISVGYDASKPVNQQPNVSPNDSVSNALGSGNFPRTWLFADGTELDLVILRSDSPSYCHIALGALQKYGSFVGGTYADGTYFEQSGGSSGTWTSGSHGLFGYGQTNAGNLRVDVPADGRTNFFHVIHEGSFARTTGAEPQGAATSIVPMTNGPMSMYLDPSARLTGVTSRLLFAADDNVFSGRHFLHPIEFAVRRVGSPAYFSPVGYVRNRCAVSLADYDPEQEVPIAGDVWKMFPIVRKIAYSSAPGAPNASGNSGFALRMVQ